MNSKILINFIYEPNNLILDWSQVIQAILSDKSKEQYLGF